MCQVCAESESVSSIGTPTVQPRNYTSFHNQRERLYRAGPGRYVVTEDVEPQQPGDLPLRRGVPVEGKGVGVRECVCGGGG